MDIVQDRGDSLPDCDSPEFIYHSIEVVVASISLGYGGNDGLVIRVDIKDTLRVGVAQGDEDCVHLLEEDRDILISILSEAHSLPQF